MNLLDAWRRGLAAMVVCSVMVACGGNDGGASDMGIPGDPVGGGSGATVQPTPLAIHTAPQAASADVGASVTFDVAASGTAPLGYQWLRDGVAVAGATAMSLVVGPLTAQDNGAAFSVRVTGGTDTVTSAAALLTVVSPPAPAAGTFALAAGYDITMAVRADGRVLQLTSEPPWTRVPTTAVAGSSARLIDGLSATHLSVDRLQALAVGSDGLLYGWGINQAGSLGGSEFNGNVNAPRVLGGVTQVRQALATTGFSLALREDGTVWHWPGVVKAELGGIAVSTPRTIEGLTQVRRLATLGADTQGSHLMPAAILADGSVWELRWDAQTVMGASGPEQTFTGGARRVDALADIDRISCSNSHCLALTRSGGVLAWGRNEFGQFGNGTTSANASTTPVPVSTTVPMTQVAAMGAASVAIAADGKVWTWGHREQNGHVAGTDLLVPTELALPAKAVQLAAGWQHVAIRVDDGSLWSWGANQGTQLGDGTSTARPTPVAATGVNLK